MHDTNTQRRPGAVCVRVGSHSFPNRYRTRGEPRPPSIHRFRDFDEVVFAADFRVLGRGLAAVRALAAFDGGPCPGLRVDFVFRATRRLPATASGCSGATSRTRSYTSRAVAEDP